MLVQEQLGVVILGTIFLFIGLAACAVAAIRGREVGRILVWFGVFSAIYGVRLFAEVPAAFRLLAGPFSPSARQLVWIITYVILIPALLFWVRLSLGSLRRFFQLMIIPASLMAVAGIFATLVLKTPQRFMPYENVLAICLLLALALANTVPGLGKKYLVIQSRISAIGTLILAAAVIYENSRIFFDLRSYQFLEPVAFALFVFSQGWVAAEKVFVDERRLLSIESELAIAREIQTSILPSSSPIINNLQITTAYRPMAEVAGDFYEFVPLDQNRIGILIADVSGHGVPAALVASMIKVAVQTVLSSAGNPGEVLRELNHILFGQLHDQFVTAAYLLIDTQSRKALYSAAGHPPLLLFRESRLQRIESNGIVFGILPEPEYPVCEMAICPGDRFLLYTDGVIEPENSGRASFGDSKLEQVIRENRLRSPSALVDQLLSEIRQWQPAKMAQQDDITIVVMDVQ